MYLETEYKNKKLLHQGKFSKIYRALRVSDKKKVILKENLSINNNDEIIKIFNQEYYISNNIDLKGVVKLISYEKNENSIRLVYEDFDGESLKNCILENSFTIFEKIKICINICNVLNEIHSVDIIHNDIESSNIIFNSLTKELKITDFTISTVLLQEHSVNKNIDIIIGCNPQYMSPEQTGMMNKAVDYRTDIYSAGIVFYELFAGILPFNSDNKKNVLEKHINEIPVSPNEHDHDVPVTISDIILKLLSKKPEDRYQSTIGIKKDFENCLNQLKKNSKIKPFKLAKNDLIPKISFPKKLYGRNNEINILKNAYNNILNGRREIVFIKGTDGIGKSSLCNEFYSLIKRRKGYVAYGEYIYNGISPYSGIINALRMLIKKILSERKETKILFKKKFQNVIGKNSYILTNIIPELKLLIGKNNRYTEDFSPEKNINRFNYIILKFFQLICDKDHPFVLILDDIEFMDVSSLRLIQFIINSTGINYFLLICLYNNRDEHSINELLSSINKIDENVFNYIELLPLKRKNIAGIISQIFYSKNENLIPLSNYLYEKSNGNPFFIKLLIEYLINKNYFIFNSNRGSWQWNIFKIKSEPIPDSLNEFISLIFSKLDNHSKQILFIASCIGLKFNLNILSTICNKSNSEIRELILTNKFINIIINNKNIYNVYFSKSIHSDDNEYYFLNNIIRKMVIELSDKNQFQLIHKYIGQLILKEMNHDDLDQNIFYIINYLNFAKKYITKAYEKLNLAQLNLIAGKKACKMTAYETAYIIYKNGFNNLGKNSWDLDYKLTITLAFNYSETAFFTKNFENMNNIIASILENAKDPEEKVCAYIIKIKSLINQNRFSEAIKEGAIALSILGLILPNTYNKSFVLSEIKKNNQQIIKKTFKKSKDFKKISNNHNILAIKILNILYEAAIITSSELSHIILLKLFNIYNKFGESNNLPLLYTSYGYLLIVIDDDYDASFEFKKLSNKINEKNENRYHKNFATIIENLYLNHWKNNLNRSLEPLEATIQNCFELGNLNLAAYTIVFYTGHIIFSGINLYESKKKMSNILINNIFSEEFSYVYFYKDILSELNNTFKYQDDKNINNFFDCNNITITFWYYLCKMFLSLLFYKYDESMEYSEKAENYFSYMTGSAAYPLYVYFDSIINLFLYDKISHQSKKRVLEKISYNQKRLKKWSWHSPENYLQKYYLIEAERYRVLNENLNAIKNYEMAISTAQKNSCLIDEAISLEYAGRYYLNKGFKGIAGYLLSNSYEIFSIWGSNCKCIHLKNEYPDSIDNRRIEIPVIKNEDVVFIDLDKTRLPENELNLDTFNHNLIKKVLEKFDGNISKASKYLGMSRQALYRKLEKMK